MLTPTNNPPTKSYTNGDFDFDLEQMQQAVENPNMAVPQGLAKDKTAFRAWIKQNAG